MARPLHFYSALVYMWVPLLLIIILFILSVFIHRRVTLRRICRSLTVNQVAASPKTVAGFSLHKVGFNPRTMGMGIVVKRQHCGVFSSKYFCFPQLVVFHQMSIHFGLWPGMENGLIRGHASRDIYFYYHNKKTYYQTPEPAVRRDGLFLSSKHMLLTTSKKRCFLNSIKILKSFRNIYFANRINILLDSNLSI